ncbi:hypothetical protein T492DRAFT_895669 [Pavlovales sp. CCMP2436]|nr:hypothetical protein T492DRAFT_895669 [Pavlovales sp. CCMP2436]
MACYVVHSSDVVDHEADLPHTGDAHDALRGTAPYGDAHAALLSASSLDAYTFFKSPRLQGQASAAELGSQAAAVWSASISPNQSLPDRKAYISSVFAKCNTLRKQAKLASLPPLASSEIDALVPALDAFFATVSLAAQGLPLPAGIASPDLAIPRAVLKHNLTKMHVTALGLSAASNAPLYEMCWTRDFNERALKDANSLLSQLASSFVAFTPTSFSDLLAGLRLDQPELLARSYDELILAFKREGLPRPPVVLVLTVPVGSTCGVCERAVLMPSKNGTSRPAVVMGGASKGVFQNGALCFSLVCVLCGSTSFVSSVHERRGGGVNKEASVTAAFGLHAMKDSFIRVSQRLVVERSYLEHMDEALANVLTCGWPVDSLRKEELNDAWFLWRLLAMSQAMGLARLELPPGVGSAWLDAAMAAQIAVVLARGFFCGRAVFGWCVTPYLL